MIVFLLKNPNASRISDRDLNTYAQPTITASASATSTPTIMLTATIAPTNTPTPNTIPSNKLIYIAILRRHRFGKGIIINTSFVMNAH